MSKAPSWTWWVSGAIAVLMAIIITIAVWPSAPLVPDDKPNKNQQPAPADYPLCAEQRFMICAEKLRKSPSSFTKIVGQGG